MHVEEPDRVDLAAEFGRQGYTLLCRLGRGATAEVFEARHEPSTERVALKVSRLCGVAARGVNHRMQTEWNVGQGLRHPNLITIHDGGILPDGRAWLAMERLIGRELLALMEDRGPLAPLRSMRIMRQVCDALGVLHRRGAVHRDVKPENIYLCDGDRATDHVKLIDLGVLALPDDDPERAHEPTGCKIIGTPLYLAPEQARGQAPDPRTDIYAVGAVLYHLLAGHPPFEAGDIAELISRHVVDPVPPLDRAADDIPPALVTLVHACMAKEREARPPDTAHMIAALDSCIAGLEPGGFGCAVNDDASIPPLPAPGFPSEWARFAAWLVDVTSVLWGARPRPTAVENHLVSLAEARDSLTRAFREAAVRREAADITARERIERRAQLQSKARAVSMDLQAARSGFSEASRAVDTAANRLDDVDERYEVVIAELRRLTETRLPATDLEKFGERLGNVDGLLDRRSTQVALLADARLAERRAAQRLAGARAAETELQRAFADLELEERDVGFRTEQLAAQAADEAQTMCRKFERACLRVLVDFLAWRQHLT